MTKRPHKIEPDAPEADSAPAPQMTGIQVGVLTGPEARERDCMVAHRPCSGPKCFGWVMLPLPNGGTGGSCAHLLDVARRMQT